MFWNSLGEPLKLYRALHNEEDGVLNQMEQIVKEIHVREKALVWFC